MKKRNSSYKRFRSQLDDRYKGNYNALRTRFISDGFKCTSRNRDKMAVCKKCYCVTVVKAFYKNDDKRRVIQKCLDCGHEIFMEAEQLRLF